MNETQSSVSGGSRDRFDAVVIGAGVIGAATTLELSRRGWQVVCVDKNAAAGSGSTLNSSAIVRFSYSTKPGIILAWEGLHYWLNWPEYIGVDDENGLIEFRQCGKLMLLTEDSDHPQRVRAMRHEVHIVPSPAGFDYESEGHVTADHDTGVYFRPEVGNNILIGSADPDCDEPDWADPDHYDELVSQSQWEAQVLRASRRMPELGIPHQKKGVADLYDVSDDWVPVYDRTDLDGFYVAIGTSGNQFKNTGVAGCVMAELITAVEDGLDHDRDPLVIEGHYTGLPIEVGFFSRNRDPAATSMSVFA